MTLKEFRELTKDMPGDNELIVSQSIYTYDKKYSGSIYVRITAARIYDEDSLKGNIYLNNE